MTQADMDAIASGAGEVGGAIANFAKGDFAGIAQGAITVGQTVYKLGKGIYNKYQEFKANRAKRTGKKAQVSSFGQSHTLTDAPAPGWLVQKVPANFGETHVHAQTKTHAKVNRLPGQSFAQAAGKAVRSL